MLWTKQSNIVLISLIVFSEICGIINSRLARSEVMIEDENVFCYSAINIGRRTAFWLDASNSSGISGSVLNKIGLIER